MPKDTDSKPSDMMKARRAEVQQRTDEANRRMEEAQPTPTEEEMQQVMYNIADGRGADIELEDSGEPEAEGVNVPVDYSTRTMTADSASTDSTYSTRRVAAKTASPAADTTKKSAGETSTKPSTS